MHQVTVGNVEIVSLFDVDFAFDPHRVWPDAGAGLEAYRDRLQPDGRVLLDCLCFLLRADGRTVLVDTGLGPESDGRLLEELREVGVTPGEIDQVVFTHLHGDHTGWNIDRATGEALFPRATYLVPRGDWDEQTTKSQPAGSPAAGGRANTANTGCGDSVEATRSSTLGASSCTGTGETWTGSSCCVTNASACVPGIASSCTDSVEAWTGRECCFTAPGCI